MLSDPAQGQVAAYFAGPSGLPCDGRPGCTPPTHLASPPGPNDVLEWPGDVLSDSLREAEDLATAPLVRSSLGPLSGLASASGPATCGPSTTGPPASFRPDSGPPPAPPIYDDYTLDVLRMLARARATNGTTSSPTPTDAPE